MQEAHKTGDISRMVCLAQETPVKPSPGPKGARLDQILPMQEQQTLQSPL
jgi:hypothetical protein